ncbi:Uncharacterised protein [Vibrio cholerae]|nr:Uncharacterised protein [Vibrio cholerae]
MCHTHERFQTFFDIWHDHQLINDRVGRLGGNNRRFGQSEVAVFRITLFGVADRRTFHWAFHRTGATTSTDVQFT